MDKGIWCLQKFRLVVNPGGASSGLRSFLRTDLTKYATEHSHLHFDVIRSTDKGTHPKVIGYYNNGTSQAISLRNKTPKEVASFLETLRQRKGRPLTKVRWANALSKKPSFQGTWSPEVTAPFPLLAERFTAEGAGKAE